MQYLVSVIIVSLFLTVVPKIPQSAAQSAGQVIPSDVLVTVIQPTGEPQPEAQSIEDMIRATFPEDPDTAVAISTAESHMNPKAVGHNSNGTIDQGIMQVNSVHCGKVEGNCSLLLDPIENLRVARIIYKASGWNAWSTYHNGSYKKYLKRS